MLEQWKVYRRSLGSDARYLRAEARSRSTATPVFYSEAIVKERCDASTWPRIAEEQCALLNLAVALMPDTFGMNVQLESATAMATRKSGSDMSAHC